MLHNYLQKIYKNDYALGISELFNHFENCISFHDGYVVNSSSMQRFY